MSDLMDGLEALREAADEYEQAEDYYKGTMFEYFASPRLRTALRASDVSFRARLAAIPVDAVAERLEIAAITVNDNADASTQLEIIWTENELLFESTVANAKACMYGDCYLIVWPNDDEDAAGGETVEIYYNSPLQVRIIYDKEKPLKKKFAIKCWELETEGTREQNPPKRANLYYSDRIERYITLPNAKGDKDEEWVMYVTDEMRELIAESEDLEDEDLSTIVNPYGEIPVFHLRNSRPYGIPEHEKAYGPQDAVNKLIITHMATIDYQGFPQRYALTDPKVTGEGSDELADFDEDDTEADETTGGDATYKAGPGEVWLMKGMRGVGQFEVADPDAFLKPLDRHVRLMASLTNTPLHYFDPMGDSPSGEALRAKEAPLVKKIKNRQQAFASTWAQAFQFALLTLGIEKVKVDVRWTVPASVEDKDGWETAKIKGEVGVPDDQLLKEGGYTDEQATQWAAEKAARQPVKEGSDDGTESDEDGES
jgi:Phage portal protein, SPP1 Gp6-like